ncbi:unnamed protein product [Adineta ricciae]|uniref:Golgin subfamily A conserved domain-containing protein n=1 Tax=Adineta ricciae TaxID=249248 RepID=A0A813Q8E7_ADIRI|nr:unnamed protein product [Adineta ricciae]CAF1150955.1 unnamed protein product [Adineta ricciae]
MVDNEKRDNLVNARRKLKKFRDQQQQQQQNGDDHLTFISETNGHNIHSLNGIPNESNVLYNNNASHNISQDVSAFVNDQQAILNGIHANLSKSPVNDLEEQNRQYALLIENQKQQRARLEDQRQYGAGSSMSGRSSRAQSDVDLVRHVEQKYRRDLEHLQEQLEIHVQTIGILVAEKTDLSAKLTQSVKQFEKKQSEVDEIQGRLKASRERIEELEKHTQNSSSNAQRREMAAKESDKEIERLRTENYHQNRTIEDLKQNLNESNEKLNQQQSTVDQLNSEITRLRQKLEQSEIRVQQYQSINDTSVVNRYEQQIDELQKAIALKTNDTEALLASVNHMRLDNEQTQLQYQQYNANMQRHVQELNEQINQLKQTNNLLENEREAMKRSYEMKLTEIQDTQTVHNHTNNSNLELERDALLQENQLFKNAIDEWSRRFEEIRLENEQMNKLSSEKDAYITELENRHGTVQDNTIDHETLLQTIQTDKTTLSRAMAQNKQLKDQLTELQDGFIKMSNDNMNLTNQIQAQEYLNRQLNERLAQQELVTQQIPTIETEKQEQQVQSIDKSGQDDNIQRLNELTEENRLLRERLSQLEQQQQQQTQGNTDAHLNDSSSLSSFSAPVDEAPQLQNGFVEKIIDRFNRAMRDNADLQDRTQQLEHLILQLQSETDTIGDYISLYQQQRLQLHRRYQEKDDYIKQLSQDRLNLQRKLSELETLLMRGLSKSSLDANNPTQTISNENKFSDQQQIVDENEWPEMIDNVAATATSEQTSVPSDETRTVMSTSSLPSLSNFDDETKARILVLLKELGQSDNSSPTTDSLSTTKLAFMGKNLYVCSTCTGPVQWV